MLNLDCGQCLGLTKRNTSLGWQNYWVAYPDKKIAVVLMSNSDNFERVGEDFGFKYSWRQGAGGMVRIFRQARLVHLETDRKAPLSNTANQR